MTRLKIESPETFFKINNESCASKIELTSSKINLSGLNSLGRFSTSFHKGGYFYDSPLAFLRTNPF